MQIPILNGIYSDGDADYRTSYPRNMIPVPKDQGISKGYLRPADGLIPFIEDTYGIDRGGYNWNGEHYRVLGDQLVCISETGEISFKGKIEGEDQVTFDSSFDYLSIGGGRKLYLFKDYLKQIKDSDLGDVIDHCWIGGYFLFTDGKFLGVTDLNDPFAVNPLKYGSAESYPDPTVSTLRHRNEIYVLNRDSIEVFKNVGGDHFPFQRVESAQIQRGCVGTHACCVFEDAIAFLGGKKSEPCSVRIGINGSNFKISTREIDQIIKQYPESVLKDVVLETKSDESHALLYLRLPDETWVYDASASKEIGQSVWYSLDSGKNEKKQYQAKNFVWCHDKWYCGDPTEKRIGLLSKSQSDHYGKTIAWEFGTKILYNEGRGAILHELELIALTGRSKIGIDPTVWTSYSTDGAKWSEERPLKAGKTGDRNIRMRWLNMGMMSVSRTQKIRGTSDSFISATRLEARLEALNT